MDYLAFDRHAAEIHGGVIAQRFIVIAGNIDDLCPFSRFTEDFLNNVVLALVPVPRLLQSPSVDDVADKIEVVGFSLPQEVDEVFGLAASGAKMDVRDPDRSVAELTFRAATPRRRCIRIAAGTMERDSLFIFVFQCVVQPK